MTERKGMNQRILKFCGLGVALVALFIMLAPFGANFRGALSESCGSPILAARRDGANRLIDCRGKAKTRVGTGVVLLLLDGIGVVAARRILSDGTAESNEPTDTVVK
jgi:hypothetical protein